MERGPKVPQCLDTDSMRASIPYLLNTDIGNLTVCIVLCTSAYCVYCIVYWCLLCVLYCVLVPTVCIVLCTSAYCVYSNVYWCLLCVLYCVLVLTMRVVFLHLEGRHHVHLNYDLISFNLKWEREPVHF